jgi:hypothetical protein
MPKRDIHHNTVRQALIKDGWTITHDPFTFRIGRKRLFADLGAARLISAEKGQQKIAVEIKSFIGASDVLDLEQALGQYVLYRKLMEKRDPDRVLYIAVSQSTFDTVFMTELGELILADESFHFIVFDEIREEITKWIPLLTTSF